LHDQQDERGTYPVADMKTGLLVHASPIPCGGIL
jgi:hypothetical protein